MERGVRTIIFMVILVLVMLALILFFFITGSNQQEQTESNVQFTQLTDVTGEEFDGLPAGARRVPAEPEYAPNDTASGVIHSTEQTWTTSSSWQDEFIEVGGEYGTENEGGTPFTTSTGFNPSTGQPYTINDLRAQGIIQELGAGAVDISIRSQNATPPPTNPGLINQSTPRINFSESSSQQLVKNSFSECGEIDVPISEDLLQNPLAGLGSAPESVCMGEAVAASCASTQVSFSVLNGVIKGKIYIGEGNDGVCSMGTTIDGSGGGNVLMCDIVQILNRNLSSDEQKSLEEWQKDFAQDPGGSFVSMTTLTESSNTESNCVLYTL